MRIRNWPSAQLFMRKMSQGDTRPEEAFGPVKIGIFVRNGGCITGFRCYSYSQILMTLRGIHRAPIVRKTMQSLSTLRQHYAQPRFGRSLCAWRIAQEFTCGFGIRAKGNEMPNSDVDMM